MFGTSYYHGLIRKYVVLFGTLFNDIWINRVDSSGNVKKVLKVPLGYGPKEKWLARINADPDLDREVAIVLPRMGFNISSFQYAAERKLTTIGKQIRYDTNNPDVRSYQYNPVPYDINFTLSIYTRYAEDGTRIIEQILPYFTPEFTPTVTLIDSPQVKRDIPIYLNSVNMDDSYEGSFEERRIMTWDLEFTMKAFLFGPTHKQKVIKLANVQFYVPNTATSWTAAIGNTDPSERITVTPGLDANGNPTTNSALTIPSANISSTDNWDYIVDFSGPLDDE